MLINTELFCTEAKHFEKYGYYCPDLPGTLAHKQYWDEQLRRRKEGYSVGGKYITGDHYNYLNFTQIKLTERKNATGEQKRTRRSGYKKVAFPHFWDGDYNFFWSSHIGFYGVEDDFLAKLNLEYQPLWKDGGHHLIVAKARRKGYSFKSASIAANRYDTVRNAYILFLAFDKKYLFPDGIMSMSIDNIDFYNEHTAWAKRRQKINKQDHVKASFIDYPEGLPPVERGFKSHIRAISLKDNPDAPRGKDATIVIFEECGMFPNFQASLGSVRPTIQDGDLVTGQIIAFGTSNAMEAGMLDFEAVFYNPEAYNFMPFENVWDPDANQTTSGLFISCLQNRVGSMDKDGNSLKEEASKKEQDKRDAIKAEAKDHRALSAHISEYPLNPMEAFSRAHGNLFPSGLLSQWRNEILRSRTLSHVGVNGFMSVSDKKPRFVPSETAIPINRFPAKRDDDTTGCVVVYQSPYRTSDDEVPDNLYLLINDPYAYDKVTNTVSIGAAYVIKLTNRISKPDDMIVASYIGRPQDQESYNRQMFLLAQWYNARIAFENDRGDVLGYAKRTRNLHLLKEEVEFVDRKANLKVNPLGRGYGISMTGTNRKPQGDIYLRDWLMTKRHVKDDGSIIYNYHMIYDLALLEELIKYGEGNFDRVSAMRVGMYYFKEYEYKQIEATEELVEASDFFERNLF